ncbi:hypothetical protein AB7813_11340 [Tardiphaga sp. 20_F10_N6_6]|jgi:hypothetical protein|uniref:hypothetical protein n=1 Tax=unclassified Tardiphaga TaxID=2631404 RepID=UPI003F20B412
MTEIASAMSRALRSITGFDVLKHFLFFCGAGILVFVLSLTYGLDLSSGLF